MIQPGAAPTAPIIVIVCGEKERMRLLIIKPWVIHFLNSVVVYLVGQPVSPKLHTDMAQFETNKFLRGPPKLLTTTLMNTQE